MSDFTQYVGELKIRVLEDRILHMQRGLWDIMQMLSTSPERTHEVLSIAEGVYFDER